MKQKIILCILLNFMLIMLAGCIRINDPDVVLKDNSQPCISIPSTEDMLKENKQLNITGTGIYETSTDTYLSKKDYPKEQYNVKTQECIDFDYDFQDGIIYDIIFTSAEKGGSEKIWGAIIRIIKNEDGNAQLLTGHRVLIN